MAAGLAFNTGRKAMAAALAASHTFKAALTNTLPLATQEGFDPVTLHPPPSAGDEYPENGFELTNVTAVVVDTNKAALKADRLTLPGGASGLGPFRYMPIHITTMPGDPLVDYIDFGVEVTVPPGGEMTFDFSGLNPGIFVQFS